MKKLLLESLQLKFQLINSNACRFEFNVLGYHNLKVKIFKKYDEHYTRHAKYYLVVLRNSH